MRIQKYLGELCIFKHRASASKNEHQAAQHIYQSMRSIGLVAGIDEFKSQKTMTWEMITILSFFLAQAILFFKMPVLAVIIGFIGLVLFWGYFTTRFKPLAPLFRFGKSNNVIGKKLNPDAPFKIIFTAHYDTARSGLMWHPKQVSSFRINFLIGLIVILALFIITGIKVYGIQSQILSVLAGIFGVYVTGQILVVLISRFIGKPVEGASDNGSGVAAMLDLANRIRDISMPEVEFWFVATGSEEVGAIGMADFLKKYDEDISKENTYFINFDNIGSGNLHYYMGEGMIHLVRFSKELINAANQTASLPQFSGVTPSTYRLAYTDSIVPAIRGYKAMLFLATDEKGLIPNWHWPTDTINNIDYKVPQLASDFSFEMVNNLYKALYKKYHKSIQDMKQVQEELGESEEF